MINIWFGAYFRYVYRLYIYIYDIYIWNRDVEDLDGYSYIYIYIYMLYKGITGTIETSEMHQKGANCTGRVITTKIIKLKDL